MNIFEVNQVYISVICRKAMFSPVVAGILSINNPTFFGQDFLQPSADDICYLFFLPLRAATVRHVNHLHRLYCGLPPSLRVLPSFGDLGLTQRRENLRQTASRMKGAVH